MNKIYTFLIVVFSVTLGYAQCDDPVAEAEQYFCTGSTIILDDLEVDPVSGTLAWFEDEALTIPLNGTDSVVGGETYYVVNDCGASGISGAVPITVYEQSVEFVVNPNSCINLGANVFFIEEDDLTSPVEIEVLNLDGNPFDEKIIWSPVDPAPNGFEYYSGTGWVNLPETSLQDAQQSPSLVFNHIRARLVPFDLLELDLDLPVGNSGCAPSQESITIIAGGLDYKGLCYNTSQTLQDVFDYYENIFGQPVTWYDEETGGNILPPSTSISEGDVFYADFDIAGCDVRIPVVVNPNDPIVLAICDEPTPNAEFDLDEATSMFNLGPDYTVTYYETEAEAETGNVTDQLGPNYTNTVDYNQTIYARIEDGTGCFRIVEVELKVREFAVEYQVNPVSCINLGGNIFFIEDGDLSSPIVIEVLNIDGDPFESEIIWSPTARLGYYLEFGGNLTGPHYPFPGGTFGPLNPINMVEISLDLYNIHTLNLEIPEGNSGCAPSNESITLIAGGLEYKEICYGDQPRDLQDVFDYYEAKGIFNQEITWYDAGIDGNIVPSSTVIEVGDIYYVDFDIAGCDVRIPVKIAYKVKAPLGGGEFFFCSDAAWASINVNITESLADVPVSGANLHWYDASFNPIVNPSTIVLEDGDIYYVTNEINGCQSEPLEIHITEKDCGCMVDPRINSNNLDGFDFFITPVEPNACNMTFRPGATPITLGTVNGLNGNADRAVRVTPGYDQRLLQQGTAYQLPRTSPFATNSTSAMRLNSPAAQHMIVIARKDFVAGEVITLDFATVLEDPSHPLPEQPFFQVNIYDASKNIIQTRCVLADPYDCIFHDAGNNILYSDWSTIKLDTREIQGEPAMVELISAWCEWTGHFGYTYVDNIFVGDDADSDPNAIASFGYIEIKTLDNGAHIYNDCSYMDMNRGEMCEAILPALNPDFPIQVCGKLDFPVNALACTDPSLQFINLNIYKNGSSVGMIPTANTTAAGFCFDLNASDINGPLYGHFTLEAHAQFLMNEGNQKSYTYDVAAFNSGFKICPVAECVEDMAVCIPANTQPFQYIFDLTANEGVALAGYPIAEHNKYKVTYYLNEQNARDAVSPITNPNAFIATGSHTIYLRLDYDWNEIGLSPEDNCYDLVSFEVTVSTDPELPTNPIELELCEVDGQIDYVFDLEDMDLRFAILDQVSGVPADYVLEFYNSQQGALNQTPGDLIPTPASVTLPVGATDQVWVRIIAPGDCFSVYPIDLVVYEEPTVISSTITTSKCEDPADPGVGIFDLEAEEPNMVDPTLGYDLAYFEDAALTLSIPAADLNTYSGNDGDIVYVEITDPVTECTTVVEIVLAVVEAPVVPPLVALEACDSGNGQAAFPLGDVIPIVQDGDTNLNVDFYASQAAADAATPGTELSTPYISGNTTVFVRANYQGADCPTVVELDLIVNPLPAIPTVDPLEQCEDPSGAALTFPLDNDTALLAAILDGRAAADFAITFHNSFANADSGAPTITEITTAVSTSVWVRIENLVTDCHNTFELDVKVNPLPSINSPVALQECDTGSGSGMAMFNLFDATVFMVGQGSNYNVTYYLTQPQAEQGDAQDELPLNYTNTTAFSQIVYSRIEDKDTGCYITEPVELEVLEAPEAQDAQLIYCDVNNDGQGTFYLPDARGDITTDPTADLSYHLTRADAENSANPLPDTVNNNMINNQQFIYVRVEIPGVGCYTVVQLELIVEPTPDLVSPTEPLIGCDIDGTGVYPFDLEAFVNDVVVVNLTNPSDYDITYFETDANGDKAGQITAPSAYTSSGGTVIVVVTIPSTGCSSEVEIELFVAPLPEVFHPVHMELCDVNNPGDEIEWFYLDEAIPEITGGDSSLIVTFHETQQDADDGVDALDIPYENDHNNQTIYIRVENEYGCAVTTGITLTLVVNPLPAPVTPEPLEVCDIDNEGYAYFDLESLENEIIANEPDVAISFHETLSDAMAPLRPLSSPYQNIVAGEQVIFARVFFEDPPNGTGCFAVVEVILRAIPSPVVPVELDDLYFCTPDVNSSVRVNLTVYEDLIYGNQDRNELELTYHLSLQAAESGTGRIANPDDYLLNPPTPLTIYVRLGYVNGECYNIVPFTLHLVEGPEINDPTALSVCTALGEPNTQTAVFDLLEKREEIIGLATGLGIYFYEDEADALIGNANYISNPTSYTNIENPQVIYVRVEDSQENSSSDTGCVAHTTLTLRVDPNPEPVTPEPIEVCHLDSADDFTIVDLTIRNLQILNHEAWDLEFYERYRHAVNGDQDQIIANPDVYELALADSPKIIYVRVINPTSGCFEIVELEVILSTLPDFVLPGDIEPMIVCTTDGTGRALFDLTSKIPEIFGNQDLTGLNVSFYEDLTEAIDGINPIKDPDAFYNRTTPQTIYVGIGNPDIDGCYFGGVTWFDIEVREGALANSPTESYKVCGVVGENGEEVGLFNLADEDLIESILGIQNPDFFDVEFFLTLEDAHEGAIEDRLGRTYENVSNPQTIYVRVTNQDTGCYAIAEVILEVITIPGLNLDDLYSICTDAFGNPMEDADGNIIYPIIDTGLDAVGNEFTWYFEDDRIIGQVGPRLVADKIGTYRVDIVNLATGCTLSLDIKVVESSMPFNYGAEVTSPAFSGTYNIEAWAEGFGDYTFALDNGTPQDHGSFTNVGIGTHVITITDRNGCGSVDVIVNVVDYPKFFTPNDDGYNDTWNIPGMGDLDPSAQIFIFDRHGKLLKQLNPQSEGWDGTFNGKPLPSTDYWFVVKYQEDGVAKEFKGHFSLKR